MKFIYGVALDDHGTDLATTRGGAAGRPGQSLPQYTERAPTGGAMGFAAARVTKPALLARLAAASDDAAIEDILWRLRATRRGGGEELAFLLESPSRNLRLSLALTLASYRGRTARAMLEQLAADPDPDVRNEALEALALPHSGAPSD